MDTDSASDSEDQYELNKLEAQQTVDPKPKRGSQSRTLANDNENSVDSIDRMLDDFEKPKQE